MSEQHIAAIVSLLAVVLPLFGIEFDSVQTTSIVQAVVVLVSSAWIAYSRSKLQKAPEGLGDVTVFGSAR